MRWLIILILFYSSGCVFAQATYNFEECVTYAFEHNLKILQQRNNEKQAAYNVSESHWNMAPTINAGSQLNINLRRSTNQNNQISSGKSYASNTYLNGSLLLFNGFITLNDIKAQKLLQASVSERSEQLKNELYLDVLQAYAQIVYEKEKVAVAEKKWRESVEQSQRIAALVEVGRREPAAIDEIKAAESGAKLEVQQANNQLEISYIKLKHLLEHEGKLFIESTDFQNAIVDQQPYNVPQIYEAACLHFPTLKAQEFKQEYLKKQLAIHYGSYAPSLSVGGGYSTHFYSTDVAANGEITPFNEQLDNYLNPHLGLSLSIPIFNKMGKRFTIKRTKLELENQLYTINQEKNTILREIEEAVSMLENSRLEYVNANDYKGFVEKSYQSNKEKYALGLINSTDFMMAQNQLASAQLMLVNARLNCLIQERIVQLYMGVRAY